MSLASKVWNTIDVDDRYLLLSAVYPNRSDILHDLESQKNWNELLPSTQKDLTDRDWSAILRRDVQP